MRLYGTAHVLSRVCTQPYKIPDSDLVLEKGSKVIIPLYSLHHDPKHYSEPYEFKPERFTPEESKERHPFVFLPFGEGPRNCIGRVFQKNCNPYLLSVLSILCLWAHRNPPPPPSFTFQIQVMYNPS